LAKESEGGPLETAGPSWLEKIWETDL